MTPAEQGQERLLAEIDRVRKGERHPEHLYRLADEIRANPDHNQVLVEALREIERGKSKVGSTYSANALRNLARAALETVSSGDVQEGERDAAS